ncbi:MAG: trypsin-like peptidase domain-containing protein [bacterium]
MNKNKYLLPVILLVIVSSAYFLPAKTSVLNFDEQEATVRAIKRVSPAVVSINIYVKNMANSSMATGSPKAELNIGSGTGFIISADGLIITNKHVVSLGDGQNASYRVTMSNGKSQYAMLIGKDPINDLALLKIFDKNLPYVELGDSDKLPLGTSVIAIGNAQGVYQNTATKGIISGVNRDIVASDGQGNTESLVNVLQTDAQINLGNSGGPLIDLNGRLVGVNVAMDAEAQSIGFAIPVNDVKPVIASAKENGYIVRPRLGVKYLTINQDISETYNLGQKEGAWLHATGQNSSITDGSPAAKAGLMDNDIIIKVDDISLNQQKTLVSLLQKYKPGQKLKMQVWRSNKFLDINVTLDKHPAQ